MSQKELDSTQSFKQFSFNCPPQSSFSCFPKKVGCETQNVNKSESSTTNLANTFILSSPSNATASLYTQTVSPTENIETRDKIHSFSNFNEMNSENLCLIFKNKIDEI